MRVLKNLPWWCINIAQNGSNTACSLLEDRLDPMPCSQTTWLYSNEPPQHELKLNLICYTFLDNRAGGPGCPVSLCPPLHRPLRCTWHPLTSTPTFLPMTMEVKQASRIKIFLCYNLALWYSDKVELNPGDKRNKPSPPSMQPHPLVNQQRISQCPHHSHRNWLISWNSPGSLHWKSAEDARNTDLLRARASTTQ